MALFLVKICGLSGNPWERRSTQSIQRTTGGLGTLPFPKVDFAMLERHSLFPVELKGPWERVWVEEVDGDDQHIEES